MSTFDFVKQLQEMAKAVALLESAELLKTPTTTFVNHYNTILTRLSNVVSATPREFWPPEVGTYDGAPNVRYLEILAYLNQAIEIASPTSAL